MKSVSPLFVVALSSLLAACGGSSDSGRDGANDQETPSTGTDTDQGGTTDSAGDDTTTPDTSTGDTGASDNGSEDDGDDDTGTGSGDGSSSGDDQGDNPDNNTGTDGDTGSGDNQTGDNGDTDSGSGNETDDGSDQDADGSDSDDNDDSTADANSLTLAPAVSQGGYVYQPQYADVAAGAQFQAVQLPAWAKLNATTGAISGIAGSAGDQVIEVEAVQGEVHSRYRGTLTIEAAEAYQSNDKIDFYARNYDGQARTLRNDLRGELAGEIQFVQSHSVAPAGNFQRNTGDETQSRYMPRLVAQRDALVLFFPHQSQASVTSAEADLLVNGQLIETLTLKHPNTLPDADVAASQVTYSKQAWWGIIPWQHVRNGMELRFRYNGQQGDLSASDIDVGLATQLILQNVRVGMLTAPPASSDDHFASNDPVLAAADYFQTMPVSRLVVANYADIQLNKVMIADGTIYDSSSADDGDVYSGDMRENVAKSQISVGINMANFGYSSHKMDQGYPHVFKQITNHHAQGQYQNGVIKHGLSGGNGIGTLYATAGNEASHEWGHAYGIGHYPGQDLTTDGRWAVHHADSGWGYIAHRKHLRTGVVSVDDNGQMSFNKDSMSGGWDASPLSRYTHYTGYSARLIQNNLEQFPLADSSFSSGYKRWDITTGSYQNYDDNRPVPTQVGVAVATLLGAYDPDNNSAVIYPVFHGNYGNVFDLAAPASSGDACWLKVSNGNNESRLIAVSATRHDAGTVNQLHINIDAAFRPTRAQLYCRKNGSEVELTSTDFDGQIPTLPEVGLAGQDHGYASLKARDLAAIEQGLAAQSQDLSLLSDELQQLINSYDSSELLASLSLQSAVRLQNWMNLQQAANAVDVLLQHASAKQFSNAETAARLQLHLSESGLAKNQVATLQGQAISGDGVIFDVQGSQLILTTGSANDSSPTWLMDAIGRLHPVASPWLCAEPSDSGVALNACQITNSAQRWQYDSNEQLKNEQSGKCLDYARTSGTLISYSCHGGSNQRWQGVLSSDEPWLAMLGSEALQSVWQHLRQ
ncbi:hypothetical protein CHH28_02200 [Bacterioplanes sanyensis]|uniref:Peptidase M66 domain-containing protein n=1 Tax=Bacterioplanes sanyensis TaxID=1249553 RepID=A0A222FEP3_9GAMM|nr:M66 family metalloprotease [Bacterioplanes sanyensis]ASP37557.1 hypothetical protein CHH28_02200 [Bacterioplanes sanyensis]